MEFDTLKAAVIAGQIATVQGMLVAWNVYSDRTGETVTPVTTALNAVITALNRV